MSRWMIYGANGYTGRLVTELAHQRGLKPIVAARNSASLAEITTQYGLEGKAFGLDAVEGLRHAIRGATVVLNCAGPFSKTAEPMVAACIAEKVHYLDVTGEIGVFEAVARKNEAAAKQGVLLLPGVGFDVVPSDCLAAKLSQALPEATELELGFIPYGGLSPGTMKTMIEGLPHGGVVRRNGKIVSIKEPLSVTVSMRGKMRTLHAIPWGDVSTAFYSTQIPNITTYTRLPKAMQMLGKLSSSGLSLLGNPRVQTLVQSFIGRLVKGPGEEARKKGKVQLWGRVRNLAGKTVEAEAETIDGYQFTAESALLSVQEVLAGHFRGPGFQTPSLAFGADFMLRIPGTEYLPKETK